MRSLWYSSTLSLVRKRHRSIAAPALARASRRMTLSAMRARRVSAAAVVRHRVNQRLSAEQVAALRRFKARRLDTNVSLHRLIADRRCRLDHTFTAIASTLRCGAVPLDLFLHALNAG